MPLKSGIAKNMIIQIVGKIASTILGLLALAIMARYLGQAGFGRYTTIINFISIFAVLADLGLTLVSARMLSAPEANEQKILNNLFSWRLLSALIFLGLGPIIAWLSPYAIDIKQGILISALGFVFVALNQIFVGLFQKRLTMIKTVIAENGGRLVLLIGVWLTWHFDLGLMGMVWITAIGSGVNFLLHLFLAREFAKISWEIDRQIYKEIWQRSWPLSLTIALNLIYLRTDTLILSFIKSPEDVGLYGAAYKIIDVLVTLPFMYSGLLLPIFTAKHTDTNYFKKLMQQSVDFMLVLAIPLVVGVYFVAPELMALIAGESFKPSGSILQILILANLMIFVACPLAHALIALDKQKKLIASYVFVAVTALIGYLILIPRFSFWGAAAVTVYSETAIALFTFYFIYRFSGFVWRPLNFFKVLGSTAIMGLVIYLTPKNFYTNWLGMTIIIIISAAIYFAGLYWFKITKQLSYEN